MSRMFSETELLTGTTYNAWSVYVNGGYWEGISPDQYFVPPVFDIKTSHSYESNEVFTSQHFKSDIVKSDFEVPTSYLASGVYVGSPFEAIVTSYGPDTGDPVWDPMIGKVIYRNVTYSSVPFIVHDEGVFYVGDYSLGTAYVHPTYDEQAEAINTLLSKVSNNKMQISVSLAEAGKTAQFLSTRIRHLGESLMLLRSGKFRQAVDKLTGLYAGSASPRKTPPRKTFNPISGKYEYLNGYKYRPRKKLKVKPIDSASQLLLEYRYALLPLIGDIQGAYDILTKGSDWKAKATGRALERRVDLVGSGQSVTYLQRFWTTAKFDMNNWPDYIRRQGEMLGFTPTSIASLLYELTPFSFVLDMFINGSDFLKLLSATFGVNLEWRTEAIKREGSYKVEQILLEGNTKREYYANGTFYHFERRRTDYWPNPMLEVENPFNLYDLSTLYALANQLRNNPGIINSLRIRT